jgi:transcriptional regulator with XRE-family HTH domain
MEPDYDLKSRLVKNGLSQKQIASELKKPHSTVSSWLNGFSTMPEECRIAINRMIAAREMAMRGNYKNIGGSRR